MPFQEPGREYGVRKVMKLISAVFSLALAISLLVVAAPSEASAATERTIRYGPFTIPAGTATAPASSSYLRLGVSRPCTECDITSFKPDLVYADGFRATMETGPMLHHAVFASQYREDATCRGTWLGVAGERFFASGDERTAITLPNGYGYRVRWYDSWNLLVEVMNHSTSEKTVYVQVKYTYGAVSGSVKPVKPVWLDIDQCGDSEYSIPAGVSDTPLGLEGERTG